MMATPKISIIMPVWNGEKYLQEAVDSLLAQTFTDFELLAMDDGSTDSTPNILASYRDPRVRHIRLEHVGLIPAERIGVAQARAEWIARQDADDISHPTRLQKQWSAIVRRPGVVFCYTDVRVIGETLRDSRAEHFPRSRALQAMKLCWQNPFTHSSVMYRKAAFQAAGEYDQRDYPADDYALWGRIFEIGEFMGIAEPLVSYRVHASSVSNANAALVNQYARGIALRHCCQFMRLTEVKARRAWQVLSIDPPERQIREWLWFSRACLPRLRWKSAELCAWWAWQTARVLGRR
jgi:glycosyltransferase involved in cell wall biosynthesis